MAFLPLFGPSFCSAPKYLLSDFWCTLLLLLVYGNGPSSWGEVVLKLNPVSLGHGVLKVFCPYSSRLVLLTQTPYLLP